MKNHMKYVTVKMNSQMNGGMNSQSGSQSLVVMIKKGLLSLRVKISANNLT